MPGNDYIIYRISLSFRATRTNARLSALKILKGGSIHNTEILGSIVLTNVFNRSERVVKDLRQDLSGLRIRSYKYQLDVAVNEHIYAMSRSPQTTRTQK